MGDARCVEDGIVSAFVAAGWAAGPASSSRRGSAVDTGAGWRGARPAACARRTRLRVGLEDEVPGGDEEDEEEPQDDLPESTDDLSEESKKELEKINWDSVQSFTDRVARFQATPTGDEEAEPLGKAITGVLEIAYRKVWVALTTAGTGPEYNEGLQQFIVACIAAYKSGYSIAALNLELSMFENRTGNQEIDQVLLLNENEKKARETWVRLVYLTLYRRSFAKDSAPPKPDDPLNLDNLVGAVTDAHQRGYDLDRFKLEQSMKSEGEPEMTKAAASLRSQFMRIVFLTNQLVSKEPTST